MSFFRFFLAFCLCSFFALSTVAEEVDRVALQNGDRLSGTVSSLAGGKLSLETAYAGTVEIDVSQIASLETVSELTFVLAEDEEIQGRLVAGEEGLELVSEGETRPLELADVVWINPPPDVVFSAAISLGANVKSGNSEQTTLHANLEGERRAETSRLTGRILWNDSKEEGVRTAKSLFGAFKADRFWSEKAYVYGSTEFLSDEFKNLDLRGVGSVGVGYQAYESDELAFFVEGGLSYIYRDFTTGGDEDEISARFATRLNWEIFDGVDLTDNLVVYPSFENDAYELRNELGLSTEIFGGWAVRFSNVLEYDSDPDPGFEEEDLLWVLGLQYQLR